MQLVAQAKNASVALFFVIHVKELPGCLRRWSCGNSRRNGGIDRCHHKLLDQLVLREPDLVSGFLNCKVISRDSHWWCLVWPLRCPMSWCPMSSFTSFTFQVEKMRLPFSLIVNWNTGLILYNVNYRWSSRSTDVGGNSITSGNNNRMGCSQMRKKRKDLTRKRLVALILYKSDRQK